LAEEEKRERRGRRKGGDQLRWHQNWRGPCFFSASPFTYQPPLRRGGEGRKKKKKKGGILCSAPRSTYPKGKEKGKGEKLLPLSVCSRLFCPASSFPAARVRSGKEKERGGKRKEGGGFSVPFLGSRRLARNFPPPEGRKGKREKASPATFGRFRTFLPPTLHSSVIVSGGEKRGRGKRGKEKKSDETAGILQHLSGGTYLSTFVGSRGWEKKRRRGRGAWKYTNYRSSIPSWYPLLLLSPRSEEEGKEERKNPRSCGENSCCFYRSYAFLLFAAAREGEERRGRKREEERHFYQRARSRTPPPSIYPLRFQSASGDVVGKKKKKEKGRKRGLHTQRQSSLSRSPLFFFSLPPRSTPYSHGKGGGGGGGGKGGRKKEKADFIRWTRSSAHLAGMACGREREGKKEKKKRKGRTASASRVGPPQHRVSLASVSARRFTGAPQKKKGGRKGGGGEKETLAVRPGQARSFE